MSHSFATVLLPFSADRAKRVNDRLDECRAPLKQDLIDRIKPLGCVHFMSITVIEDHDRPRNVTEDHDQPQDAYLAIEITSDRDAETTLALVGEALREELQALFDCAGLDRLDASMSLFLIRNNLDIGQRIFGQTLGLTFSGSPDMTVERIIGERDLAEWIGRTQADVLAGHGAALDKLHEVREELWKKGDRKWAFFAEPVPWDGWERGPTAIVLLSTIIPMAVKLVWPLLLVISAGAGYATWRLAAPLYTAASPDLSPWLARISALLCGALMLSVFFTVLLLIAGGLAVVALWLRERADAAEDIPPDARHVGMVMERENFYAQNLLATISPMKPGRFRRFTLRVAFAAIGRLASTLYIPGFLSGIGVIHFARWVMLPNANNKRQPGRILFWSNYDGSLESYLEDFIERAHEGVTAIWSNARKFPVTRWLFTQGAQDGDRLRRFVLRSQNPVRFWYSAYPDLTMARIRTNALIRHGIATARSEPEAAKWLACFGTANATSSRTSSSVSPPDWKIREFSDLVSKPPVPYRPLEFHEIQSLALGGMSRLYFGVVLAVRLSCSTDQNRTLLRTIEPDVTYGTKHADHALAVGLAASALEKIGLRESDLATFPPAFLNGMTAAWRSRALGDTGCNDPVKWKWGNAAKPADIVLFIYAETANGLTARVNTIKGLLYANDAILEAELEMQRLKDYRDGRPPMVEPFGFADGISQPVIRGGPKHGKAGQQKDLIEAGEIILGYRDNLGYLPSTPVVMAENDRRDLLYRDPDFQDAPRDLGRNGTFVVVRQLRQDTKAFDTWVQDAGLSLQQNKTGLGSQSPVVTVSTVQGKLMGRWTNGTPLPLHPAAPGFKPGTNFTFGATDPSGLVCPLGAHIRRANPRDSLDPGSAAQLAITNRHRILRVGRPYDFAGGPRQADHIAGGPRQADQVNEVPPHDHTYRGEAGERGLIFMCVNADIGRQFEFLQQTWLLGASFHGLENEVDPLIGTSPHFTIPTPQGPLRLTTPNKPFSRVYGGGYFFMAGRTALRYLAEGGWIQHAPVKR